MIGVDANGAVIAGSPGVDNTIVAGSGTNQVLTGGGSSDLFTFLGSGHHDTVTDFNPKVDKIDFEGLSRAASFHDLIIHGNSAGGSIVQFAGNSVTLTGVHSASLSAQTSYSTGTILPWPRRRTLNSAPDVDIGTFCAASLSRPDEARCAVEAGLALAPASRVSRAHQPDGVCDNPTYLGQLEPIRAGVGKAGLLKQ